MIFAFVVTFECREWSAALTSPHVRCGLRGNFRSHYHVGGKSMAALRVNLSFHHSINAEHKAGQIASIVFHVLGIARSEFEPILPNSVARARTHCTNQLLVESNIWGLNGFGVRRQKQESMLLAMLLKTMSVETKASARTFLQNVQDAQRGPAPFTSFSFIFVCVL